MSSPSSSNPSEENVNEKHELEKHEVLVTELDGSPTSDVTLASSMTGICVTGAAALTTRASIPSLIQVAFIIGLFGFTGGTMEVSQIWRLSSSY